MPRDIRDGDFAYAWQLQDIYDVLSGQIAWQLLFTRWSHPTEPTVRITNRNAAGPALVITREDGITPIFVVGRDGVDQMAVGGFIDIKDQPSTPAPPGAGTGLIRVYADAGQLWFLVEGSAIPQQIPIGAPPGSHLWQSHWFAG